MPEILVLAAHPQMEHSRVTRALVQAAQTQGPAALALRDLYALYPDYFIDVAAEQAALAAARLVVWLHPIHWYGMPPLAKLWLDEVFAFGWAYGPGGQALRGKHLWLVSSTGGPAESYQPLGHNRHDFDDFMPPYEQTAALTGMRWLPPQVLHGAHRASGAELAAHVAQFLARLQSWPSWPELADGQDCPECLVPAEARPAD